jgi:tetratricopeptide (TPR) repeat protein
MQTAAAVAVAPSIPRSNTMPTMAFARVPQPNTASPMAFAPAPEAKTASPMAFAPAPRPDAAPAMAFARALEPDAAPNLLSVPSPRPLEPAPVLDHRLAFAPQSTGAGSGWEAVVRGRPWLAALAAGAVIATVVLVAGRRPTATRRESSVLAPTAVRPAPVALRNVSPPSPPPPTGDRDVDERRPARPTTSGSPAATRHANEGAPAHAAQRGHHEKRRAAHPTRGKHQRVVAMQSAAAPKGSEDERSARAAYDRGNQRLLSGDTAAAIAAYEEAVRSAPSSPSGYRGLGLAYEKAGKSAEAIRAFRQYLKLAPSSGDRDLVARRLRHLLRSGGDSGK